MEEWKTYNKKELENLENIVKIKMATVSVKGMYPIQTVKVFKEI